MKEFIITIIIAVVIITLMSFGVGYRAAQLQSAKTISELNEKIEVMNIGSLIFQVTYRNGESNFILFDKLVDDLKHQRIATINYTGYAEITNSYDEITED
jgi:hypothetical protein